MSLYAIAVGAAVVLLVTPAAGIRDDDVMSYLLADLENGEASALSEVSDEEEVLKGCFKVQVLQGDVFQDSLAGQEKSQEGTERHCQQRCRVTEGCGHFNYLVETKTCHLQTGPVPASLLQSSTEANESKLSSFKAITGPPDCGVALGTDTRPSCYNLNLAFDKDLSDIGYGREKTDTPEDCKKRCMKITGCHYFSWWSDGGCHVHPQLTKTSYAKDAVSGPRVCSECVKPLHARSGANLQKKDGVATQDACREFCVSMGQGAKDFSFWSDGGCQCHGIGSQEVPNKYAVTGPITCSER